MSTLLEQLETEPQIGGGEVLQPASYLPSSTSCGPQPQPNSFGIDMLRFSVPCGGENWDPHSPTWTSTYTPSTRKWVKQRLGHRLAMKIGDTCILKIEFYPSSGRAYYELNPSRVLDPFGWGLCDLSFCKLLVPRVVQWTADYIGGSPDPMKPSEARLHRLDLARNFVVTDPRWNVKLLLHEVPKYQGNVVAYLNKGVLNTLSFGRTTRKRVSLYDKRAEVLEKNRSRDEKLDVPPVGTFRVEAQMSRTALKEKQADTLANLRQVDLWKWLQADFDKSNWGHPVALGGGLADLLTDSTISVNARLRTAGYLVTKSKGIDIGITPQPERELRQICKSHGLSPGRPLDELGGDLMRLDFETGTLVPGSPTGHSK